MQINRAWPPLFREKENPRWQRVDNCDAVANEISASATVLHATCRFLQCDRYSANLRGSAMLTIPAICLVRIFAL